MTNGQPDLIAARNLNVAIMAMAEQTPVHQREEKVVNLIRDLQLDSSTLAIATASLQFNSQVHYESTEQLRRTMKIMLDAQMLRDELAAAQHSSDLIGKQIVALQDVVDSSYKQAAAAQRTAKLIEQQIAAQEQLAVASDKQARASNFLGRVNIFLAFAAVALAAAQVYIAVYPPHSQSAASDKNQVIKDGAVGHSSTRPPGDGAGQGGATPHAGP